jgi:endonuclease IV
VICESPILDVDARKMKETLKQVLENKQSKV